jgi:hypothetical protein
VIYFTLFLIFLAGIYSVFIVGVTGGPNHGEHPLLITLVHFGVFYFSAGTWPEEIYDPYCRLLVLCLFASIVGYGSSDYATGQGRFWLARGMLLVAYVGLIILYLSFHKMI